VKPKTFLASLKDLDITEKTSDSDLLTLIDVAQSAAQENCLFVEIGTWKGKSAACLAYVAAQVNGTVVCVDHFQGNAGTWNIKVVRKQDILALFRKNMEKLGFWQSTVKLMVMDSQSAAFFMPDESADLIFMDGDHTYNVFSEDLKLWYPKVKHGGTLCGHDCEFYYTDPGIIEDCLANPDKDFLRNSYAAKKCFHPGVVRGVAEFFGSNYEILPETTLWVAQRKDNA